jgi:hypothetical protein
MAAIRRIIVFSPLRRIPAAAASATPFHSTNTLANASAI